MEAVFSHPIISSFLKQYDSKEHMNCLQALSLIGISLLQGKSHSPESLYKISLQLARNPAAVSIQQTQKSTRKPVHQNSMKSRYSLRNQPKPKKQKIKKSNSKHENNWNLKLYGSVKPSQRPNREEEANTNKFSGFPYKQIEQISIEPCENSND